MSELRNVLFVEDDPNIFELLEFSLAQIGKLQVFGFSRGMEALEQAPQLDPQLILLDVMMPEMDGPTVLQKLRQLDGFAHKPIVFLTAKTKSTDIEKLYELGAASVLSKPFNPIQLANELSELWKAHSA